MTETLSLLKTSHFPNGVTIPAGGLDIPETHLAVMTVDGVATRALPGNYEGNVVIELLEKLPSFGKVYLPPFHSMSTKDELVAHKNPYRSMLMVNKDDSGNQYIDEARSAMTGIVGGEVTASYIKGGTIKTNDDWINGVTIQDGDFRIEDTKFDFNGRGGDDFELFGSAIAIGGYANVVIDNVDIVTHGNLATALGIGEKCNVLVQNTTMITVGDDNREYRDNAMTEVPWVLGLLGTVRTSNCIGKTVTTFYNVDAATNGWGVFSTDDAHDLKHNFVNSIGRVDLEGQYKSGYGEYCVGDTQTTMLGMAFENATYGVAGGGTGKVLIGASSKENLEKYLGTDTLLAKETNGYADIEARNSVFNCTKNALMFHGAARGTVGSATVLPGTEFISGGATVMIKCNAGIGMSGKLEFGTCPTVDITGAKVQNNGVLLHFMQSDDAGVGNFGFDKHFAEYYEVPFVDPKPFDGHDLTDDTLPGTMKATFRDMEATGDIYNSVFGAPQNLSVTLESVKYSGAVTTGAQYHIGYQSGDKIYPDKALDLGNVGVIAQGGFNNGLILKLTGDTVWTVTGTSYLTRLEITEGASVAASEGKKLICTVNGVETALKVGSYTGEIVITVY